MEARLQRVYPSSVFYLLEWAPAVALRAHSHFEHLETIKIKIEAAYLASALLARTEWFEQGLTV